MTRSILWLITTFSQTNRKQAQRKPWRSSSSNPYWRHWQISIAMTRNSPFKRLEPWDSIDVYGPCVCRNTKKTRNQTKMTELRRKVTPNWATSEKGSSIVPMSSYFACIPLNRLWDRLKNDWLAFSRTGINAREVIWLCWWISKGAREGLPTEGCHIVHDSQGTYPSKSKSWNLKMCYSKLVSTFWPTNSWNIV